MGKWKILAAILGCLSILAPSISASLLLESIKSDNTTELANSTSAKKQSTIDTCPVDCKTADECGWFDNPKNEIENIFVCSKNLGFCCLNSTINVTTTAVIPKTEDKTDKNATEETYAIPMGRSFIPIIPTYSGNDSYGGMSDGDLLKISDAFNAGFNLLKLRDDLEKNLADKGLYLSPYSPAGIHGEYQDSYDTARKGERRNYVAIAAIQYLVIQSGDYNAIRNYADNYGKGPKDKAYPASYSKDSGDEHESYGDNYVENYDGNYNRYPRSSKESEYYALGLGAKPVKYCKAQKYRTIDGSCNNLRYGDWGQGFRSYMRLLRAQYGDGVKSPRKDYSGYELPSPRLISTHLCPDFNRPQYHNTLMVMQFGQFIAHDIAFTPIYKSTSNKGITCCSKEVYGNPLLMHPECYPIKIPKGDIFETRYGRSCMEFVRSLSGPGYGGRYGRRQQINQMSSYLDASHIYGYTDKLAREIRTYTYGHLKTKTIANKHYLITVTECYHNPEICNKVVGGDPRVSQQPWLTALSTAFVREHNYVADALRAKNPHWDDEYLYQEARRFIIAALQHITYKEFLPWLFGYYYINKYGLGLLDYGYSYDYNSTVNPTIVNEFATSACRLGHTLIQGIIEYQMYNKEYNPRHKPHFVELLRNVFFRPQEIEIKGGLDRYLQSLIYQKVQTFDRFVSREVTNYLFKTTNSKFGLDLVSFNIQRGRDHGIASYNQYRVLSGLKKAYTFNDLYPSISYDIIYQLQRLYKNVNDIDLFIGGLSERPLRYSTLGPTFATIVANQFRRLKKGDRFWYELGGQPSSFTKDQLQQIRKLTLARIICNNADYITHVQRNVFEMPRRGNPIASCKDHYAIPVVNFDPWKQSHDGSYSSGTYVKEPYAEKPYAVGGYSSKPYGGDYKPPYDDKDNKGSYGADYKPPYDDKEYKGSYGGDYKPPYDDKEYKGSYGGDYKPPYDNDYKGTYGGDYKPPYDDKEYKGSYGGNYKPHYDNDYKGTYGGDYKPPYDDKEYKGTYGGDYKPPYDDRYYKGSYADDHKKPYYAGEYDRKESYSSEYPGGTYGGGDYHSGGYDKGQYSSKQPYGNVGNYEKGYAPEPTYKEKKDYPSTYETTEAYPSTYAKPTYDSPTYTKPAYEAATYEKTTYESATHEKAKTYPASAKEGEYKKEVVTYPAAYDGDVYSKKDSYKADYAPKEPYTAANYGKEDYTAGEYSKTPYETKEAYVGTGYGNADYSKKDTYKPEYESKGGYEGSAYTK